MKKIDQEFDIYIVGTGIKWLEHITLEVDNILGRCEEILYVEKAPGIETYFYEKAPIVTDLTQLYSEDKHRETTYRQMASKVIESALKRKPVAFAIYGHPTIFAYPPFLVREMAQHLNLSVKILPGISAMDCLFADLAIDPSVNGVQMYEATDLLLRKRSINPDTATLIWQIGSLGTALFSTKTSESNRYLGFKDYLLQFFPEDHTIYSVFTNPHPNLRSQIHEFKLSEFENFSEILHAAVTLYIPPSKVINDFDMELAKSLSDPNYLRTVTRKKEE